MTKLVGILNAVLLVVLNLFMCSPDAFAQTFIQGPALVQKPTLITSSGGTTTLTAASNTVNIITGTSSQTIVLPDATTLPTGRPFFISNESTGTVTVNMNGGTAIGVALKTSQAYELKLNVNTTAAGQWDVQQFGAGGISSVALTAPSFLSVTGSPLTQNGTLALSYSGTALPIANGGTGSTSLTTNGLLLGGASSVSAVPPNSTSGVPLLSQGSSSAPAYATLGVGGGGTGATTQQAAINSLTGTQTAGKYLRSDGTNSTLSSIVAADVPTLNQNTTGTAANITGTSNSTLTTLSALSLPASQLTGTLGVPNGGTGATSLTTNGVLLGGTTVTAITPGSSGQVLTSTGASTAPTWQPAGTASPLTTNGDLYTYTAGANARLPVGTSGQNLQVSPGGLPTWTTQTYQSPQNLMTNPNFENNSTSGWSVTGGTLSTVSVVTGIPGNVAIDGLYSGSWSGSSVGNVLSSANFPVRGLLSSTCSLSMAYYYSGASGDLQLIAQDGGGNPLGQAYNLPKSIPSTPGTPWYSQANPLTVTVPCVNSGATGASTIQWSVIRKVANSATFFWDDAYIGAWQPNVQAAQAQIYATAEQLGSNGCVYQETTSSAENQFVTLSNGSSCSQPWTVVGNATMTSNSSVITLPNAPAGFYSFEVYALGILSGGTSGQICAFQFNDGTTPFGYGGIYNATANATTGVIGGAVNYATAGTRTISIQAAAAASGVTCGINNYSGGITGGRKFEWIVKYYPNAASGLTTNPSLPVLPTQTRITTAGCTTNGQSTCSGGVYTPPPGASVLRVTMSGAGGGGGGSGTGSTGGTGGTGGAATFGTSLLVANGGVGGGNTNTGTFGVGGTATIAAPATGQVFVGGSGTTAQGGGAISFGTGGAGGSNMFGGGGGGSINNTGYAGASNTGAGGGGAGTASTAAQTSDGGGAGGYLIANLYAPLNGSYAYSVGAGGTAGAAGTSGFAGGAGGSGVIIIDELYQSTSAQVQNSGVYASTTVQNGLANGQTTIDNGVWGPTFSAFTNIASVGYTGNGFYYLRIGKSLIFGGAFNASISSASAFSQMAVTLPTFVTNNFTDVGNCGGTMHENGSDGTRHGPLFATSGGTTLTFRWMNGTYTGGDTMYFNGFCQLQ